MTDQTVPVPVDLLKRLKERYPSSVVLSSNPISDLTALIPAPLKAGDVLTDFGQIADLPSTAVLVDKDNDVYVVGVGKATRVTDGLGPSAKVRTQNDLSGYGFSIYSPFTLHYVPEESK